MNYDINLLLYYNMNKSYQDKKKLSIKINKLKKRRFYIKLFKIIIDNNIDYTTNNNGVFFNISQLNNEQIKLIENYVNECYNKMNISYNDSISSL